MGLLRKLCGVGAVLLGLFACLFVPAIEDAAATSIYSTLDGVPLLLLGSVLTARHFAYCLGDYLGCVKQEIAEDMVNIFKWKPGAAKLVIFSPSMIRHGNGVVPAFFSHDAYRSWAHDTKAGRPNNYFVLSDKADLPDGVLPDGEPEIMLNFDTGSEQHFARRKLLADALPALAYNRTTTLIVKVPPVHKDSIKAVVAKQMSSGRLKQYVFDLVGYNLFWELFGVDIAENLDEHFEYDATLAPGVLGIPVLPFQGKRLAAIRGKIMKKVEAGSVAKAFRALATERGLDPTKRLNEMVWIAMFAGYGGTSNLVYETLKMILGNTQKYLPMFKKDPRAFMIEAARLHPPVGGMNPVASRAKKELTLGNAVKLKMAPGDIGIVFTSGANVDPNVFQEPKEFVPNRANSSKVLSWNNELGAFATCDTIAGCPAAPRGCPGTWLSLRLATAVTGHFVEALSQGGAHKGHKPEEL